MAVPGGVKLGKPRGAPRITSPHPEVAKSAPRSRANVLAAKQKILETISPSPHHLTQPASAPSPHHLTHPVPTPPRFQVVPPHHLTHSVEVRDTKTGARYLQTKQPTDRQVSNALKRLFHGDTDEEQAKGLVQLERYGVVGNKPAKPYSFQAQPVETHRRVRLGYAPGGKPILDMRHFEQDAKGRPVFDVNLGGHKFQAVHGGAGELIPISNLNKLPGTAQAIVKAGVFAGDKTLGTLGDIFHFTGTPGRELANTLGLRGGGLKGIVRTGLEIAGDPTTWLTAGTGTALKGAARAAAAAGRLEKAGVALHSLPRMNVWLQEAQQTGDATKLAQRLAAVERQAQRKGITQGQTITQKIAARAIERGKSAKAYLPGEEATQAVAQRIAPAIRDLRRPGAHIGRVTITGSKIKKGRYLPEVGVPLPRAAARIPFGPVLSTNKRASIEMLRAVRERSSAFKEHGPALEKARTELKALEDLGPAVPHEALTAARGKVSAAEERLGGAMVQAEKALGERSSRLASLEERRAIKNSRALAHRAIISSAEAGRVTRAQVGKSLDNAIKPLRSKTGKIDDKALSRVWFHLAAHEGGGGAGRNVLPKLTDKEEEVFSKLGDVYRSMRDQGEDLGFLQHAVEDYIPRIFKGHSPLDIVNEMIGVGRRPTGGGFMRHRTAANVFDLASPAATATELKRVFGMAGGEARHAAEELYQRGSVRFTAEKLARRLQRGQVIHVDKLSGLEKRAIKYWGEYRAAQGEAPLFRTLDDPNAEGRALLQLSEHKDFEHLAPGTLSDEQKLSQIARDLSDAVRLNRAAHEAGDTKQALEYGLLSTKLEKELHDYEESLPRSSANGVSFTSVSSSVRSHEGATRALASIHSAIADIRRGDQPVTFHIVNQPRRGAYGWYSPDDHTITLNAARSPVGSTAPHDIAVIRSQLIHELAHARTINENQFFGEAARVSELANHMIPARKEAARFGQAETPGFARSIAERLRDQKVLEALGGEEVASKFRQINSALLRSLHRQDGGFNLRWNADEHELITYIGRLNTERMYEGQRQIYGRDLTNWMESTARHMQLLATNPEAFREAVGAEATDWLTEKVLRVQLTDLKPSHLEHAKFSVDPDGKVWIMGKDGEPPTRLPPDDNPPYAAGPHEDPFDLRARDKELFPIVDPRVSGWYRMNAQARVVTLTTRWKAMDRVVGRSTQDSGLVRRGDRWYDPRLKQEYMAPEIAGEPIENIIGKGRVWPTQVVADTQAELARMGELNDKFKVAGQAGIDRVLSQVRWGVTAPFPAYHIRNLVSDALKSLQADSGVMFHPIMNAKLSMAAFRAGKGRAISVPGVPEIKTIEDFLFFADAVGIRSGEHMADFGRIVQGSGKIDRNAAMRLAHGFQRASISVGSHREDVVRFMTFVQRLRRNGGDAADAAWYMIQHHFDYNDLTAVEKRFARNTFLFYTWYRKNIPLQFIELLRRPGFMAGVSHIYEDLSEGNSPINVNWSKLNPMLPDLTGAVPKVPGLPSYINNQLAAVPLNWNDHAVYLGFGAPWADMGLMSKDALQTWVSMLAPVPLGIPAQLYSGKESLTGRDLNANEPSGAANIIDAVARAVGLSPLQRDQKGRPVLPKALHLALQSFPILGRAGGSFTALSETRDQGRLSHYGHTLGSTVLGVNTIVEPKADSPRLRKQLKNAVSGLLSDREDYYNTHRNLFPGTKREHKKQLDRLMRKYDKEVLLPGAKEQGISTYQLRTTKGWSAGSTSTIYKRQGRKRSAAGFGTDLGGGSLGGDMGGGSLSP